MRKNAQIIFISLATIFLFSACGKKEEPAKSAESSSVEKIPEITQGIEYPAYKKSLIEAGWTPVKQDKECGINCQGQRADGFIETEDCGDAGIAPCTFVYKNKDSKLLKIYTAGENLAVQKAEGDAGAATVSAPPATAVNEQKPAQQASPESVPEKKMDQKAYFRALNSKFGPSGWAECINGSVTVMAVSIKYNQTLPADVKQITTVVEDTLGAMRKQMLADGVPQSQLDSLIRAQPRLASGDQALKVVGTCFQKMEKIYTSLQQ